MEGERGRSVWRAEGGGGGIAPRRAKSQGRKGLGVETLGVGGGWKEGHGGGAKREAPGVGVVGGMRRAAGQGVEKDCREGGRGRRGVSPLRGWGSGEGGGGGVRDGGRGGGEGWWWWGSVAVVGVVQLVLALYLSLVHQRGERGVGGWGVGRGGGGVWGGGGRERERARARARARERERVCVGMFNVCVE
jgi:hypothetical protein